MKQLRRFNIVLVLLVTLVFTPFANGQECYRSHIEAESNVEAMASSTNSVREVRMAMIEPSLIALYVLFGGSVFLSGSVLSD